MEDGMSMAKALQYIQRQHVAALQRDNDWRCEREELLDRIAFLEGQLRGHELVKENLFKRIQLLESVVKELRNGVSVDGSGKSIDSAAVVDTKTTAPPAVTTNGGKSSSFKAKDMLKKYLAEVGIDESTDLKSVHFLHNQSSDDDDQQGPLGLTNAVKLFENARRKSLDGKSRKDSDAVKARSRVTDSIIYDPDEPSSPLISNMNGIDDLDSPLTFQSVSELDLVAGDTNDQGAGDNSQSAGKKGSSFFDSGTIVLLNGKSQSGKQNQNHQSQMQSNGAQPNHSDPSVSSLDDSVSKSTEKYSSWKKKKKSPFNTVVVTSSTAAAISNELAGLSMDDVNASSTSATAGDIGGSETSPESRVNEVKLWKPKFTLRSHFDSVRCAAFHPEELTLLSGSEDGTIKLWNLEQQNTKKSSDIEPVLTFRGHTGSVNALSFTTMLTDKNGQDSVGTFVSGGYDGMVRLWSLPSKVEPYGRYQPKSLELACFQAFDEIIWDLKFHPLSNRFVVLSSIGVKVYSIDDVLEAGYGVPAALQEIPAGESCPTSFDFVKNDPTKILIGFADGSLCSYDLETCELIQKFGTDPHSQNESEITQDMNHAEDAAGSASVSSLLVNKVVCHPTESMCITAHENRKLKFYDITSGQCTYQMIAHLDSVSSLDISPNGQVIITAGHDSSVRLWDINTRSCLQEFSAHRKKYDESIHFALFHPKKAVGGDTAGASGGSQYLATGGCDSCVKLYGIN
ncbi:hypothetical protein MP228_012675 [Amoeboaphelidium protococcarum]|nr:hypothetical protein MP228_012675 [Amoeboaphelidium protococcarum]